MYRSEDVETFLPVAMSIEVGMHSILGILLFIEISYWMHDLRDSLILVRSSFYVIRGQLSNVYEYNLSKCYTPKRIKMFIYGFNIHRKDYKGVFSIFLK